MIREHRLEILLVVMITLLLAFWVRTESQQPLPIRYIEEVEEDYGIELGEPPQWFRAWSLGDGQAYAAIAADPSGFRLASHVHEAAYRFARAGYGWATAVVSFGDGTRIPYGLAVVGGLSVIGVIACAVILRDRLGMGAWWILVNPALYIGFAGDTPEPLGILLLVTALAFGSRVSGVLLGVTRPTFLMAAWGQWRVFLPGLASAVILAGYSLAAFGGEHFAPDGGRLGFPLLSYFGYPSLLGVLLGIAAVWTTFVGVRTRDWAWVLAGLLVLCFGGDVLRDPLNAWRAAGFLPVMWAFGPGYRVADRSWDAESALAAT